MRAKSKLVSFALCALLMLGFALTASAQVNHTASSTPNEVVQYGATELMGEFRLTAVSGTTVGSTITVTYTGNNIANVPAGSVGISAVTGIGAAAGGITVQVTGAYIGAGWSFLAQNTGLGGQVVISVPGGFTPVAGNLITVNGVRVDLTSPTVRSVGYEVVASLSSTPSNANSFTSFSTPRVAVVNTSMTLTVTGVTDAICISSLPSPTIRVKEGFSGAFVQYTTGPNAPRTRYGATGNTQVRIVISNLPAGVTLTWPATSVPFSLTTPPGVSQSTLVFVSQSGTGNSTVVYEFNTTDQGGATGSDTQTETFEITPTVGLDPLTAVVGQSTAQAQLYPASSSTVIPRFNHPLIPDPGLNFIFVSKCVTNLLFPFVANVAGYDTGMAIANTSYDVDAINPTTTTQSGPVTLFLYPQFAEPGPQVPPLTYTVANVSAGNTWAGSMSQIPAFAGKEGYIIAVAQFQFAHGFGFISLGGSSGLVLAEGYVANVIPDISLTQNVRRPDPAATAGSGENIGH